jgi:hypothetical protein
MLGGRLGEQAKGSRLGGGLGSRLGGRLGEQAIGEPTFEADWGAC